MSKQNPNAGTVSGIERPDDDSGVAENTEGTEWDLSEMSIAHVSENKYRVLSTRNNTINHYEVDIGEGTCSCPSEEYNLRENEACPHLSKALLVAPSQMEATDFAARDLEVLSERARNLLWDLRDTTDWIQTVVESEAASQASDAVANGESTQTPNGDTVSSVSASEAAEKLQAAFDETVTGMAVEYSGGKVWVNKTPDAPDYTFDAFLSGPDLMQYDPDDADSPGQYFSNYIEAEDVSEYISEVLE
jgi:hypothetical protein